MQIMTNVSESGGPAVQELEDEATSTGEDVYDLCLRQLHQGRGSTAMTDVLKQAQRLGVPVSSLLPAAPTRWRDLR
jgi:hypothetical protein